MQQPNKNKRKAQLERNLRLAFEAALENIDGCVETMEGYLTDLQSDGLLDMAGGIYYFCIPVKIPDEPPAKKQKLEEITFSVQPLVPPEPRGIRKRKKRDALVCQEYNAWIQSQGKKK